MRKLLQRIRAANWDLVGPVVLLNLGVALAAFLKDVFLAKTLGTSPEADALTIAFFLPDAIGNNLYAYAIGVVCVPLFAREAASGAAEFRRAVGGALATTQMGAAAILLAVAVSLPWIVPLFGQGASVAGPLAKSLSWLLLPTLVLFPLQALSTAALQSTGRFRRAAASPLVFNVLFLLVVLASGAVAAAPETEATLIAIGITISVGAAVWYIREPLLHGVGALRRGAKPLPLLRLMFPFLLILLFGQVVLFAERMFASRFG
ncbi:MAG TPA: lipid II flippase MurJ, partial [Paenibacillus sp.]|nr:lipid II flippase MurJ [Paenibacillus sp.]